MSEEEKEVYLGQLASTVREADSFRIHTKESDIARKRLEEFVEARMDPQTLKDLHDAKASADRDLLEKGVGSLPQGRLYYKTSSRV